MNPPRKTTSPPQKRRRALRAGGMASRLRGNDGVCMRVGDCLFDSDQGNKLAVWGFEVDTLNTYSLAITSPAGAQTVNVPKITVSASASANKTYPTRLTVGGVEMTSTGTAADGSSSYSGTVDLIDGVNTLTVVATYADGETRSTSTQVSYDAPPKLTILSPADKAVFGPVNAATNTPGGATNLTGNVERPVTVTGRLSKPVTAVTINQQQAQLEQGGMAFSFANFFLREGTNMITAVATDALGRITSSAITVNVDQTAPILRIESPDNLSLTSAAKLDVRGMVNDAVEALHGAPEPTVSVTVNGKAVATQASQVSDRYFLIPDVPLQIGQNTLRITATDHLGNARSQDLQVSRIAVGSDRLTLLSGNNQTAAANTELAKPLVIVAINAAGEPLAGQAITFDIQRGSGSISTTQGAATKPNGITPARNLTVSTDSAGRALVWLTVGKQTGPGANVVQASNPKLLEQVTFTASTQRGAVFKINADLGTNQIAETNAQPLELLSAVVRDANDNLLPNVPVVFTIEEGDASFPDTTGVQATANPNGTNPTKAAQRIILATDKNGLVALRPLIGSVEGTIRIKAQALKLDTGNVNTPSDLTGNATFLIQAKAAQDGPASFSGFVYDDKSKPLPGIKLSIGRTNLVATTDASGKFELSNIPPGRIDLFVDGRTFNPTNDTSKPQYPSLHFEAYAVKGRDNQLAHPIYLPALSTSAESVKTVGGNEDVILTIPGLAGFSMKVKANSVTFPDGSRVGTLIVSPVTADRLPMAPPAGGAQFGVPAWTIQPAGTRFDPPIEVTLPNASSQPVGDNLPIVQWDHDLGQYVAMGRATVSEDGAVLVTDSGSGITKAGWGGLCRYDPDKCAVTHPPSLSNAKFTIQDWNDTDDVVEPIEKNVTFKAEVSSRNCTPKYEWNFDGVKKEGKTVTHLFSLPKKVNVKLTVSCKADCDESADPAKLEKSRDVFAAKLTFEEAWSDQFAGSEANGWKEGLPKNGNATGPTDKPYALMAVRNDDAGYVRVKYKLEPQETVVKERVKFGLVDSGQFQGESGACPNASGTVTDTEACIKIQSPSIEDKFPAWGIDKNKDGKITNDERPARVMGEKSQWKFRMVSQATYQQALSDYSSGVSWFGALAQEWLSSFRDGFNPGSPNSVGQGNIVNFGNRTSGLTHAVGAITSAGSGRVGQSKNVIHPSSSPVVKAIMDSPAFYGWIYDTLQVKASEIDEKVGNQNGFVNVDLNVIPGVGGVNKLTTVLSGTPSVGLIDLYAILGDAQSFTPTLRLTVSRHPLDVTALVVKEVRIVNSVIEDMFDWDYDVTASAWIFRANFNLFPVLGPMAKAGAMIQAAHGTIGRSGGMVFKNIYQLDSTRVFGGRTVLVR
jgi:hypothetical protein